MRLASRLCVTALTSAALAVALVAGAQPGRVYTDADYRRAASMLNDNTAPLVDHAVLAAHSMPDDRFWYLDTDQGVATPMVADPHKRSKDPVYDPLRMAASLQAAGVKQADPRKIAPTELALADNDSVALLTVNGGKYRCTLGAAYTCTLVQPAAGAPGAPNRRNAPEAVTSPDGKRTAFIRDWNLWSRDLATGTERQLTTDGIKDFGYATDNSGWTHSDRAVLLWAPDSRHIATFQQDQRRVGDMYMLTSEIGHPKLEQWKYPMVGDKDVIMIQRVIVDADTATTVRLTMPPDNHRSTICDDVSCSGGWDDVQWATDSQTLAFVSSSRDHKLAQVRIATASTGAVRDVFQESSPTFFESGYTTAVNWRYLSDRDEILWWSQRSNWGNLYLYSAKDGRLLHPVTTGNWNVEQILYINQENGSMLLTGSGREHGSQPDTNPYYRRIYSTNLDGKSIALVSPEDADHTLAAWSSHGHYLVDIYSTPQTPQTAVLRDRTGKVLLTLATADITRLKAAGWQAPETFHVKGHDGTTDVYGLLFRPAGFDPAKKYPVIDFIYPGPFDGSFTTAGGHGFRASRIDLNALPQLGFAVVAIEGMGNPHRSKEFQDTYVHDIGLNAVPDQVSGLKELAGRYPWIDLDRTGMWGHSGGGNATAATMFRYPGFIKVGIAESGNHENRDYEDDWDEKYVGLVQKNPDGTTNYDSQANAQYAKNLEGKLLLAHGVMDDNVPLENTMLLVDALEKANKSFDLILFPRAHHGYGDMVDYMMRRRWDYFVTNLMGGTPPVNFLLTTQPAATPAAAKPAPLPTPKH